MFFSIHEKTNFKLYTASYMTILCGLVFFSFEYVFSHNFSIDESLDFLIAIDKIKVESKLAYDNVGNNDDKNFAEIHANNAILYYDSDIKKEISEKNQRVAIELDESLNKLLVQVESEKNGHQISTTIDTIESIGAALLYGAAVACEKFDRPIDAWLNGAVSGHTLKHLLAALALYTVYAMLRRRRPSGLQ